ncbi:MAG: manganese catalase family protein [Ruminococcus sp.]|nr:manganese catalase family protein [Ruminococcus sp.]
MYYNPYVQHGYGNKLQYPVKIKNPDPRMAKVIISQLGGLNTNKL